MNDELQKALASLLNKTVQGAEAGAQFLQRELPEVIQQLLLWHAVKSAVFFTLFLVLAAGCAFAGWRLIKNGVAKNNQDYAFIGCIFAVAAILLFWPALAYHLDWLQILLAPKVYLIEYAASLAR